jgi:hypothetical protein
MNYKLSKLALGLATVLVFSGQANASSITENTSEGFVNGSNGSYTSIGVGTFTDTFNISVTSLSNITGTVTALNGYGYTPFPISLNTASVTESLYSGATLLGSWTANAGNGYTVTGTKYNAAPGNYILDVTATAASNFNTDFASVGGYQLTASVTPVPEPTEGALLLSGIGLLGFIAARRKTV